MTTEPENTTVTVMQEPEMTFEVSIIEKEAPVKVTAALIREKAAPLMALTIDSIFDEKGYEAVKKAKTKAVKMRTSIKSKEDEVLKAIKTRHGEEIKQVTDYTAELYTACLEAQNDLQGKLDKIDKKRKEAADKIAEEKKAKTDGRNAKMFELSMLFNGVGFSGYGKYVAQEVLHAMADDKYLALVAEIEGLSMEQSVTGVSAPEAPAPPQPVARTGGFSGSNWGAGRPVVANGQVPAPAPAVERVYDTAVYERVMPELGARLIITKGMITAEPDAIISNDRILESAYYVQIVR